MATCTFCGNTFKENQIRKHLKLCELIHNTKSILTVEEDLPSQRMMFKMVLVMANEITELKRKVDETHTFVSKKIKKINIVDYLNCKEGGIPSLLIHEIILVKSSDIDYLFHHTVFETIDEIISRSIYTTSSLLPFAAFVQKPHTLYGFIRVKETNENKWDILSNSQITSFLEKIQFKLSKELIEWKKKNELFTDEQERKYDKTVSKLMTPDFKNDLLIAKFRKSICEKIKKDFITQEYEFE
jgi:hypothetical protein